MRGILADNNVTGHLRVLLYHFHGEEWQEIWSEMSCEVKTFVGLGIDVRTSDADIWRICQQEELVLLTANRNQDGPDSLEESIRRHNTLESLPVLTFADAERVLTDRPYAAKVAEKLLERLLEINSLRGAGRLYLP